jgi:hypothetical protein
MTIVRTGFLRPFALIIHDISKSLILSVECKPEESEIAGGQSEALIAPQFIQENAHQKSP